MAIYQELMARSQQVRDEQNIGGNTALRVGQLLMDIVKYFNDNDAAASEYLQQHFAMVNDGTHLLNWQQSPIVILHTMGETYDEGDFSSLSQGENYYRNGFIMEANGQGGGINGETPKANVLYVNLANDTLYTWNGASFDAITSGGGGSISGDDILKNAYYSNGNLVLVFDTESGDKTVSIPVNFDASNYVPTSRTVNDKALSNNITLSQSDIPGLVAALAAKVGYSDDEWLQVKAGAMQAASAVPNTTTVNGKRLNNNITIQMADIPGLLQAIANAGSGAVSVTTNQDGTFVIHVGETDYTINLNHTHEGMAKLVVDTAANLPDASEMESDTIYGELDDGEIATIYLGGYPFYGGGGGGTSTPVLRQPADGSTIDVGKIASGESSVTKTITVKGKNLTQALTVAVTGTGYSANKQTISAADANVGTTLTITCTSTADDASGTLSIASSEVSCDCDLVANVPTYEDLRGIKLTGDQWMQTDYKPNANTEFRLTCRFEQRSDTQSTSKHNYEGRILSCEIGSSGKGFEMRNMAATSDNLYNPWNIGFVNETSIKYGDDYQVIPIGNKEDTRPYIFVDPVQIYYTKGSSTGTIGFTDGTHTLTKPTSLKTSTQENAMMIGRYEESGKAMTYSVWNLTIYSLVITENGTEVRHWVPKLKNGTIPGLYDTVTGTFISSETSTELVAVN